MQLRLSSLFIGLLLWPLSLFAQDPQVTTPGPANEVAATEVAVLTSAGTDLGNPDAPDPSPDPQTKGTCCAQANGTCCAQTNGTCCPQPNGTCCSIGSNPIGPNGYVFPTRREMNRYWIGSTIGPRAPIGAALRASWTTWISDSPREWGSGPEGWAKRFGVGLLDNGMNQSALVLMSLATHQDPKYYRCDCTGFWPRTKHAIILAFDSRKPNGDYVLSAPKIISGFVGPMVTRNTIYPARYNSGDAAISGLTYLAGSMGWNWVKEFIWKHPWW
jgi:hypothetical protein